MYTPKRGYEDVSYDRVEYYPARALSERDQTLVDTAAGIDHGAIEKSLGYFVTRRSDSNLCANDIHR